MITFKYRLNIEKGVKKLNFLLVDSILVDEIANQ